LDKLTFGRKRPSAKSDFGNLHQLYSIVGNFKQSCSKLGYIEYLH